MATKSTLANGWMADGSYECLRCALLATAHVTQEIPEGVILSLQVRVDPEV